MGGQRIQRQFGTLGLMALAVCLLLSACSTIPSGVREQVDPSLTLADAKNAPARWHGKTFLLGGRIEDRTDVGNITRLRIQEYPLDAEHRPHLSSPSYGSFLVLSQLGIDSAEFLPGKQITMAGRLTGTEPFKGGDKSGRLPSFEVAYLRTWEPSSSRDKPPNVPAIIPSPPAGGMNSTGFDPLTYR
jgi:outer membrane lipoprotein